MSDTVFLAVLAGALLHAGWNAVIKLNLDRRATMVLLGLATALVAVVALPFLEAPRPPSWPFFVISGVLQAGYKLFLTRAYEHADLSQAYPLARGTAPLIVALVSILFLGQQLAPGALFGIAAISGGILVMALRGGSGGRMSRAGLEAALMTAGFIAAYTLVDGAGARRSGSAVAYAMWVFIADAAFSTLLARIAWGSAPFRTLGRALLPGLLAGTLSAAAYAIPVWAFTRAPVAMVSGLREVSILFAMGLAALAGERFGPVRLSAAGLILLGVVAMKLA